MPKYYKIFIIIMTLFFVGIGTVAAAQTCSITNPYYNSGEFKNYGSNLKYSVAHNMVYEITNIQMNENTFEVYGWAFDALYDTSLDGSSSRVELEFYPVDDPSSSKTAKLDVIYATPASAGCTTKGCSNGTPKYFDYTFWQCYKKRSSNVNYCMDQAGDSSGNAHGWPSPTLQGGFKASIDFKEAFENGDLEKGTEYNLRITFYGPHYTEGISKDASVFTGLVDSSVKKYAGYDKENDEGKFEIKITGFGETAEVIVSEGIPTGQDGLACSSPFKNLGTVYYQIGDHYYVDTERIGQSCRGKTGSSLCDENGNGAGSINVYQLYTKNASGGKVRTSGSKSGNVAYAPASWIKFDGTITIKTKDKEEEDPDVCEGDEIYYLYYYFADGVAKDFKGNINYNATFKDATILQELEFESNADMIVEGGPLSSKTVKKSFDTFYNNFWSAIESGQGYIEQDGKYYLIPDQFLKWPGGGTYTFTSEKNYDQNSLVSHAQSSFNRNPASSGLGYQYTVQEAIDYSKADDRPKSIKQSTNATDFNNMYKHFTVYQLTVCRNEKEEAQCEDTVTSAVCLDGDNGTHAIYHENSDIKNCTLEKGTHSGFTIVEEEETTSPLGTVFGTVACKEDLDFYLPGGKETAAGQYFILNNYIPKIEALRTCATSPIKYDTFDNELKTNYEPESVLPLLYNRYRDDLYVYKNLKQPVDGDGPTTGQCDDPSKPIKDVNGVVIGYDPYIYNIDQYKMEEFHGAPNEGKTGIYFAERAGHYIEDPGPCSVDVGMTRAEFFDKVKTEWENTTRGAKGSYESKLQAYHQTVLAYNTMFSWTETVTDTLWIPGGDLEPAASISTVPGSVDTTYTFKPDVTFNYQDPDGSVFPVAYKYPVTQVSPGEQKDYWGQGAEPDDKYENGGAGLNQVSRELINCADGGDTCTTGTTITGQFYTNGAVRRDEDIEYEYHLPEITTTIPDGRVFGPGNASSKPSNKTSITLEAEAVPVNINTLGGQYTYTISVEHFKDQLRSSMYSKNTDDDWADDQNGKNVALSESRFVQRKVFNAGEDYVCTYDVINDIYLPGPQKFNFFYRVVDTYEINPLGRTLGYNWTDDRAEEVRATIREDALDVMQLYDGHEKFVYTLSPTTMQAIRSYNAKQDEGYSDWDLVCSDYGGGGNRGGYHCYSNFLECLVGGGGTGTGTSCTEIVGAYHDNGDYGITELNQNRSLLIQKQNALDGRG